MAKMPHKRIDDVLTKTKPQSIQVGVFI